MDFENPTPSVEKEPRFPSLEEIVMRMKALIGDKNFKEERKKEDEKGINLYEVSVMDEKGITAVYAYRRASANVPITSIDVAYCNGSLDDNDWIPGGRTLSHYDENTREWDDGRESTLAARKNAGKVNETPTPSQEILKAAKNDSKTEFPAGWELLDPPLEREAQYQLISEMLDKAVAAFGATSLEEAIEREEIDVEAALQARKAARPWLLACHRTLTHWVHGEDGLLRKWTEGDPLSEEQFDTVVLRIKKLWNLIGTILENSEGIFFVQHNVYEV